MLIQFSLRYDTTKPQINFAFRHTLLNRLIELPDYYLLSQASCACFDKTKLIIASDMRKFVHNKFDQQFETVRNKLMKTSCTCHALW